jgi:hypothetical protein
MGMGAPNGADLGETRGISIDLDFNLWVSDSVRNKIFKLSNSSLAVLASFDAGNDSIGVGVDARGNIWAVDRADNSVARYDAIGPTRTGAAMQFPVRGNYQNQPQPAPYTYSDMLGTLLNLITRGESRPLWTTIRELSPNKRWYKVYWELEEAGVKDGLVKVSIKCLKDLTANTLTDDRDFVPVENGGDLPCKSDRYLQIKVQFDSDLAILKNLRVTERS